MLPWVKAGAAQGIISSAQVVGEINEADAQRAESNGVGRGGGGEEAGREKEKLDSGTVLLPASYLLSSE